MNVLVCCRLMWLVGPKLANGSAQVVGLNGFLQLPDQGAQIRCAGALRVRTWLARSATNTRRQRQARAPDGRPFFMAGLWSDAPDPATGEVADTYTAIITDANAAMRVHDRMPVILATECGPPVDRARSTAGRAAGALPGGGDAAWRVGDAAKNSRIEPHAGMAEPVSAA